MELVQKKKPVQERLKKLDDWPKELLVIHFCHPAKQCISAPPELLQFFHRVRKCPVEAQRQGAGYLDIMKQHLTLPVPQFNLEERKQLYVIKQ